MSMLAEKRVKRRYNLQPRGKALYEDSNRFGTRMLEKMGWSKGKGLGPNETGNKEFVRVKYKSDSIGLGFEERDDQWTQHDNDFNGLLRSLNGSEQNSSAEEDLMPKTTGFGFQVEVEKEQSDIPQISGESLEEKSKKSKARVHYQKFTRGKDISRYSEKDLANIFGKKSLRVEKAVERQEEEEEVEEEEKEHNFGVTVIKSGTSINDYFKQKMSMKRKMQESTEDHDYNEDVTEEGLDNFEGGKSKKRKKGDRNDNASQEPPDHEYNEDATEEGLDNFDVGKSQKKKKRKDNACQEPPEDHEFNGNVTEEGLVNCDEGKSQKKKKRDRKDNAKQEPPEYNEEVAEESLVNIDLGKSQKKKKRERRDNASQEPPEDQEHNENVTEEDVVSRDVGKSQKKKQGDCKDSDSQELDKSHKKKKSKKSSELLSSESDLGHLSLHSTHEDANGIALDNVEQETESESLNRPSKTKKNKKSKHLVEPATACEPTEAETQEESLFEAVSKKRKRKDKIEELLEEDLRENEQVETSTEAEEVLKKKKKKKKDKRDYYEDDKDDLIHNTVETLSDNTEVSKSRKELAQTDEHESKSSKYKKSKQSASADLEVCQESHPNEASAPLETSQGKSKLKKSKTEEIQAETATLSSNTTNSVDEIKDSENYCVFQLNGYNAEIFRYINFASFAGSNFSDIVGYGLTKNIKLEINSKRIDTQKIQNLWTKVLNKYTYKKRRNLKVKSVKQRNVFRVL